MPSQDAMTTIFHEYAHLLFRHNHRVWPLWLNEGMAEFYGNTRIMEKSADLGRPIDYDVRLLSRQTLLPLSVKVTSAELSSIAFHETLSPKKAVGNHIISLKYRIMLP